jgi:toxin ParE1/3/4
MRRLADFPEIGRKHPELEGLDLRVWAVHSYLILYRPSTVPLDVVRVIHGARDLASIFGPHPAPKQPRRRGRKH